jgi:hypothetical protein
MLAFEPSFLSSFDFLSYPSPGIKEAPPITAGITYLFFL